MKHGNIYPPEQAGRALENFFTPGNLTALRDIALRATARQVEDQLDAYIREGSIAGRGGVAERIMVAVDHRPIAKTLIRRGWRMAAALKADLLVVHVEPDEGHRRAQTLEDERQLRSNLQLADELGATVIRLTGKVAEQLIVCARERHVSQLVIGHPTHGRLSEFLRGSVTSSILREIPGIDVHVVADRQS
jgi:two-component system sensor histidine kinase KdpD